MKTNNTYRHLLIYIQTYIKRDTETEYYYVGINLANDVRLSQRVLIVVS
jgi:hypothetical protein